MSKARLAVALSTFTLIIVAWAVSFAGTAYRRVKPQSSTESSTSVSPIRFRDDRRGLIVEAWINNIGPFNLAIDTGAGTSIITNSLVQRAGLKVRQLSVPITGGLSSTPIQSNQEASFSDLAIGYANNHLPAAVRAAVVQTLPGSIDGILDPAEIFGSLSFSVNFQKREIRTLETKYLSQSRRLEGEGTIVKWVTEHGGHRPFVRLADGRLALIDTGSTFGLAFSQPRTTKPSTPRAVHDLGGGSVEVRQVPPRTVTIGSLVLRNIPTEILINSAPGTPVILGRRALNPFKITFDRASSLIAIESVTDTN